MDEGVEIGGLPFVRVTFLGKSGVGKSSLTDILVNNRFTSLYTRTDDVSLNYTTIMLSSATNDADSQGRKVLIEIEDPFGSNRVGHVATRQHHNGDAEFEDIEVDAFYDFWWPRTELRVKDEIQSMKKESRSEPDQNGYVRSLDMPMGLFEAPIKQTFKPLTKNRMAWLIVFACDDEASFQEAQKVYGELTDYHTKNQERLRPVIYIVGNKADLNPTDPIYQRTTRSAKAWCDRFCIPLRMVSADESKGVRKMLKNAVQDVLSNPHLWCEDMGRTSHDEDTAKQKCSMQ